MTLGSDYQNLVASTRLTLAETFDLQTRLPKDFKEIHAFHKKAFPDYPIKGLTLPLDIAILSFSELPNHRLFLTMLAQALRLKFHKNVELVGQTGWEKARFVIAPDYGIASDPLLAKHFREGERAGQNFLGNTPLFLLTDLALYMREPKLKNSLWKALCQEVGSLR